MRPLPLRGGYGRRMSFTMAPAFFSTDLDRTAKFWGALGFIETRRYEEHGYMILEHPMGIVIHFGLDPDLVPSKNMTNAYLRFTTADEAVALHDEWVGRLSDDGFIHAPGATFYGMIEWGMTDPDANALRVGGPAEPD
jgi:hypothetical protein